MKLYIWNHHFADKNDDLILVVAGSVEEARAVAMAENPYIHEFLKREPRVCDLDRAACVDWYAGAWPEEE